MAVPLIQLGAVFLGSAWAYKEGYVTKFMDKLNKNDDNNRQSSNNLTQQQPPPQPLIIHQQIPQQTSGKLLPFLGVSSLIAIGYLYYSNSLGTKKVINKVDKTSKQTQGLVKKGDENNAKRFIELDKRNTQRNMDMELQIRSETKAGFKVVTEQLYCLTQVCIQTLGAIANGSTTDNNNNGEFYGNNEKLLGYADKAQEMADTILSEKHLEEVKNKNLKEMRAEIHQRNNKQLIEYTKNTPGMVNNKNTPGNDDKYNNYNNDNNNSNITTYNNMDFDNDNNDDNNNILNYFKLNTMKKIIKKHIINQIFNSNNDESSNDISDNDNDLMNLKNIKLIAGGITIVGVFALWKFRPSNNNQYQYQYQYENQKQQ